MMLPNDKVKGPASYFPSIEKKYGQPIKHWLDLVATRKAMKHMEIVAWLKTEHGLGHGHANAIVAYALAQRADA
jgi:monomeric isocitrate dehydrogenase